MDAHETHEALELHTPPATPSDAMPGALQSAAAAGNVPALLALLAQGAQVNAAGEGGWTPLMFAAACGQFLGGQVCAVSPHPPHSLRFLLYFVQKTRALLHILIREKSSKKMLAILRNAWYNASLRTSCSACYSEVQGIAEYQVLGEEGSASEGGQREEQGCEIRSEDGDQEI